jgi:hypothetical protein
MPAPLKLEVTDYLDETRWRWVLYDARGAFLGDHDVRLNPAAREYRGWLDLQDYLEFWEPTEPVAEQLRRLGDWVGREVFGPLRDALMAEHTPPATPVLVILPPEAEGLVSRPLELARCEGPGGRALVEAGIRFIYPSAAPPAGAPARRARPKAEATDALRLLAAFSLPDQAG